MSDDLSGVYSFHTLYGSGFVVLSILTNEKLYDIKHNWETIMVVNPTTTINNHNISSKKPLILHYLDESGNQHTAYTDVVKEYAELSYNLWIDR